MIYKTTIKGLVGSTILQLLIKIREAGFTKFFKNLNTFGLQIKNNYINFLVLKVKRP